MVIRNITAKADMRGIMLNKKQQIDCKLGLVNGNRKCGVCDERKGCTYAEKAFGNKVPHIEGMLQFPSMSYPVQEKKMELKPFHGTSGFC